MIDGDTRTLGVILACFVALVVLGQSAQRLTNVSAAVIHPPVVEKATVAPVVVEAPVKNVLNQLVEIPKDQHGSMVATMFWLRPRPAVTSPLPL